MQALTLTGPLAGLDLNTKIGSLTEAQALAQALRGTPGAHFVGRYLSRVTPDRNAADLDSKELGDLLTAGLCVMPLQHYAGGEVAYSGAMGAAYGAAAAYLGLDLNFPAGTRIYVDVESPAPGSAPLLFTQAWVRALRGVSEGRFVAGLYTGAPGLDAQDVAALRDQGFTCAEVRGCGAPDAGEQTRQYGANTTLSAGGYRWTVDRDLLLPHEQVSGFIGH